MSAAFYGASFKLTLLSPSRSPSLSLPLDGDGIRALLAIREMVERQTQNSIRSICDSFAENDDLFAAVFCIGSWIFRILCRRFRAQQRKLSTVFNYRLLLAIGNNSRNERKLSQSQQDKRGKLIQFPLSSVRRDFLSLPRRLCARLAEKTRSENRKVRCLGFSRGSK